MITPSNLTLSKDKKLLTVTFENKDYSLTSEYLRVYSPSAEVQGHGPGQETLQLNKNNVKIEKLNPYYDLRFDDNNVISISGNKSEFEDQIKKFAPNDLKGYRQFMRLSERQYNFAFSKKGSMGRSPMHRLWDTLKVLPKFALLSRSQSYEFVFQRLYEYLECWDRRDQI